MSEDTLQATDSGITIEGEESPAEATGNVEPGSNTGAELAAASPEEGEGNTVNGESEVDSTQKAINKQHFKFREEQRRANELQAKLDVLEAKNAGSSQELETVTVPPIPDSWDDDYAEKMRVRDEAIGQNARVDSKKVIDETRSAEAQLLKQQQQAESSRKLSEQFTANATKLNVSPEALDAAQQTVISYGITPELATELLQDADGPLMVQHLAANPLDLQELVTASPFTAGRMLAEVKAKAAALKPKTSDAPDPATALGGRGAPAGDHGPDGATFE